MLPHATIVASVLFGHAASAPEADGQSRREVSLPVQSTSASATGRLSGNTCTTAPKPRTRATCAVWEGVIVKAFVVAFIA